MKYHVFNNKDTEQLFRDNRLSEFEQLWTLESDWFEKPNYRRNGWSGVIRYELQTANGEITPVFIKRQENHNSRTLLHPLKGIPTFRQEFLNIQRLKQQHIPTLTCLYYGERQLNGNSQSIIITRALEGFHSLADYYQLNKQAVNENLSVVMKKTGQLIRTLHEAHFHHGSLYPKHFFVQALKNDIDVRIIDLEKLSRKPFKAQIREDDLSRFIRRHLPLDKQAVKLLIDAYLDNDLQPSCLSRRLYALLERQAS